MKKFTRFLLPKLMFVALGLNGGLLSTTASAQWFGYVTKEKPAARVDLDADINRDGRITPADGGALEVTPPGLCVRKGILEPAILGFRVIRPDFRGDTALNLEVRGINRRVKKGKFRSVEEELAVAGRIRVWADKHRRHLLLDSADPTRRKFTFTKESGPVPRDLYIEGVSLSEIPGSLQLIAWVGYKGKMARFSNSHDYILVTVTR